MIRLLLALLLLALPLRAEEIVSGVSTSDVSMPSRATYRLIHQSGSFASDRSSGFPVPGRSSNSPRSVASRIRRSTQDSHWLIHAPFHRREPHG